LKQQASVSRVELHSLKNAGEDSYWNLSLTWDEVVLLGSAVVLILIIQLQPILQSRFALPLAGLLAAICFLSPVTGFLFIACSQFLPFPEEASLNPSQIGFLVWLPVVLFRYFRVRLTGLWRLWPVLPWLIWYMLMTGDKIYLPGNNHFKALCYAVIACQLVNEARGQYLKCLFGLAFGASLVMSSYWANHAGLPVELSDWGGDREGIPRTGGTRADAVMVWPALLIGVAGMIGIQLALGLSRNPRPSPTWLTYLTVVVCMGALPPLVATMTHGAIASFALLAVGIIVLCLRIVSAGGFARSTVRQGIILAVVAALLTLAGYTLDAFSLRSKVKALEDYYKETARETGVLASRGDVWVYSIRTILKYPIFGVINSHEPEEIAPEFRDNPEGYVSHNVFLDYGRFGGIPGLVLLAFFFFFPAVKMWFSSRWGCYTPFLLTHFALFIFWMGLSYVYYKTFWAFWILSTMAATHWPDSDKPIGRKRDKVEQEAVLQKVLEH
jgi:hypothetical protein